MFSPSDETLKFVQLKPIFSFVQLAPCELNKTTNTILEMWRYPNIYKKNKDINEKISDKMKDN